MEASGRGHWGLLSMLSWYTLYLQFVGVDRDPELPFFVAPDGIPWNTYSKNLKKDGIPYYFHRLQQIHHVGLWPGSEFLEKRLEIC